MRLEHPARRIAIIQGHPDPAGHHLLHAMADAYAERAIAAGHAVRRIEVAKLECDVVAVVSPARKSSINASTVKPCASITASVQPSRLAASNSSARRWSGLGPRLRLRFVAPSVISRGRLRDFDLIFLVYDKGNQ
jgi:hypothetical protein